MEAGPSLLIIAILCSSASVVINIIWFRIVKRNWLAFLLTLPFVVPVASAVINGIITKLYKSSCSNASCLGEGIGAGIIFALGSIFFYVVADIAIASYRFIKRKRNK